MASPYIRPGSKSFMRLPGRTLRPSTLAILIGLLVTAVCLSELAWIATPDVAARRGGLMGNVGVIRVALAFLAGALASAGSLFAFQVGVRSRSREMSLGVFPGRREASIEQFREAEKMTALGELVAGVAHEVNNPLASIMGYTQLILSGDLPAGVRRRLETVFAEAERAGKIVRNLLTFARKQPPEKKYLGLNGIIEKTLELKVYHFRSHQIEVEKDLAPDLPMTMLDYSQMQQVLLNLFNNAEQAMEEIGRGGTIRLSTCKVGDYIEARISDDGPGIAPEIQSRVFEPFFTTKKEGKGTGLGLPLCYGIIREHGGDLRLESCKGGGCTFIIELPIHHQSTKLPPQASEMVPSSARVLVIDPDPTMQSFLVELLTSKGYRPDTASDVPQALKKIEARDYSLILTDTSLPRGSGKDIYQAVLAKDSRQAERIVFMNPAGMSDETERFAGETGNPIISKPCRIEEIEQAITRVTHKSIGEV